MRRISIANALQPVNPKSNRFRCVRPSRESNVPVPGARSLSFHLKLLEIPACAMAPNFRVVRQGLQSAG